MSRVSDEQLIATLLTNGTKKSAAAALGISESVIYDRMKDKDFKAMYSAARADLLRETLAEIQKGTLSAVRTIVGVMENTENNPAVRLQAAQTLLNTAGRIAEALNKAEEKAENKEYNALFSLL